MSGDEDKRNQSCEGMATPASFTIGATGVLDLAYQDGAPASTTLYGKAKQAQWDASERIDWRLSLDPENLLSYDDRFLPVFGSAGWAKAGAREQVEARNHYQAHMISQLLHGEQGAMVAAGQLVQVLPTVGAKMFAAQQAADEARHVEIFQRLIRDKVGISYGFDPGVDAFLRGGLEDERWDVVVLTTQVLLEGFALGVLQQLRDFSRNELISSIAMKVMADESRHVSYGLGELEVFYAQLGDAELRERADFARDGMSTLQKGLNPAIVWRNLGLDAPSGDEVSMAMVNFNRFVARLSGRVEAMLERLRLREPSGVVSASERLNNWARADERVLNERLGSS